MMTLLFLIVATLISLVTGQQAHAGFPAVPDSPGCQGIQPDCNICIYECVNIFAQCYGRCFGHWQSPQCDNCFAGFQEGRECVKCLKPCFHVDTSEAKYCVDCSDPAVQRTMCIGSFGEIGFCTATGKAAYVDNGGQGCSGATPDCDIVLGAMSQCPASSFHLSPNSLAATPTTPDFGPAPNIVVHGVQSQHAPPPAVPISNGLPRME